MFNYCGREKKTHRKYSSSVVPTLADVPFDHNDKSETIVSSLSSKTFEHAVIVPSNIERQASISRTLATEQLTLFDEFYPCNEMWAQTIADGIKRLVLKHSEKKKKKIPGKIVFSDNEIGNGSGLTMGSAAHRIESTGISRTQYLHPLTHKSPTSSSASPPRQSMSNPNLYHPHRREPIAKAPASSTRALIDSSLASLSVSDLYSDSTFNQYEKSCKSPSPSPKIFHEERAKVPLPPGCLHQRIPTLPPHDKKSIQGKFVKICSNYTSERRDINPSPHVDSDITENENRIIAKKGMHSSSGKARFDKHGRYPRNPSAIMVTKKKFGGSQIMARDEHQQCERECRNASYIWEKDYTHAVDNSIEGARSDFKIAPIHSAYKHNIAGADEREPRRRSNIYGENHAYYQTQDAFKSHSPNDESARVSNMPYTVPWGKSGWYSGEVTENVIPDGMGSVHFKNGEKYDGQWKNGYPDLFLENGYRTKRGYSKNCSLRNETIRSGSRRRKPAHSNFVKAPSELHRSKCSKSCRPPNEANRNMPTSRQRKPAGGLSSSPSKRTFRASTY